MNYAAEDAATINAIMEYERGLLAAAIGTPREVPEKCPNAAKWYEGWDVGARLVRERKE
jgi:hypothetical protein